MNLAAQTSSLSLHTSWIACRGWFSAGAHDAPAWIGINEGRIAEIATTPPASGEILFGDDPLYAVPLLSDTHVHCYMEPWPVDPARRKPPGGGEFEAEVAQAIRRVDEALALGLGLLRDMGDPHGINLEVKRRLARRDAPAPELLAPGPGFHRPKKYGRFLGVSRDTAAEVCASIDALHREGGIDYVKVVTTGIVDFAEKRVKQPPQYTAEELTAVVDHAHRLGYKVASHCSGQEGIDINLAAGVDFIEHAYFVREEQIDRMVEKGSAWTPTFAPVHAQGHQAGCGWSAEVRQSIESILAEHAARIAYGVGQGATILAGSDAGSPGVDMGHGIRLELNRLATAGISAGRLLHMATVGNARALGAKSYSPVIEAGRAASFALYAQCPWRDIRHLDTLQHVFCSGRRLR